MLFAVTVLIGVTCALQRDGVRRLRIALPRRLLRLLRIGGRRFNGFGGEAGL